MIESFIFSGMAFVTGNHAVTNDEIEKYINSGCLEGFDTNRIEKSQDFIEYKKNNPNETTFSYMTSHLMGFRKRFHVVPFPPTGNKFNEADNSLDLCVTAIEKALADSSITGNDVDAWYVGTATAHQFAPGIAEFAKAYFTDIENQSPTYSLTSACVGFNINLANALMFFKIHPEANHIVIAHSEVMSALLPETKDFVPFSTFGDAAAAVVLTRIHTETLQGVVAISNNEDGRMLDFLGADKKGNLYMNPRMVKMRAVPNIVNTSIKLMNKLGWKNSDLKYFIPHQTGNAIVDSVKEKLEMPDDKVFKDIQLNYGNLSGASVPASICLLRDTNKLKSFDKLICSVAGLGGEFGGFAYVFPDKIDLPDIKPELKNKRILITGASGGIGRQIAVFAAEKGADIILHYNSRRDVVEKLQMELIEKFHIEVSIIRADLTNDDDIILMKDFVEKTYKTLNFFINTHAITGSLSKASEVGVEEFNSVMNANYESVKKLCIAIAPFISESILITGSVGEDAQFSGSSAYVASKRALRAFAVSLATKVYTNNVRCIYYLSGIVDAGMMSKLEHSQISISMSSVRQKKLIPVTEIADRMLKSVYRLKIPKVRISYESNLMVVKDGYLSF